MKYNIFYFIIYKTIKNKCKNIWGIKVYKIKVMTQTCNKYSYCHICKTD